MKMRKHDMKRMLNNFPVLEVVLVDEDYRYPRRDLDEPNCCPPECRHGLRAEPKNENSQRWITHYQAPILENTVLGLLDSALD